MIGHLCVLSIKRKRQVFRFSEFINYTNSSILNHPWQDFVSIGIIPLPGKWLCMSTWRSIPMVSMVPPGECFKAIKTQPTNQRGSGGHCNRDVPAISAPGVVETIANHCKPNCVKCACTVACPVKGYCWVSGSPALVCFSTINAIFIQIVNSTTPSVPEWAAMCRVSQVRLKLRRPVWDGHSSPGGSGSPHTVYWAISGGLTFDRTENDLWKLSSFRD